MEKKHIFTGTATALVTPMNEAGVDYEALGNLIDWQIAAGIQALVVCATTGEAPTLTDNEHCKVLEFAIQRSGHRIPIIAGTGSNDTAHAIMMTQFACAIGADAVLCVTPYYNRPTQSGLIASYTAIADASPAPAPTSSRRPAGSWRTTPTSWASRRPAAACPRSWRPSGWWGIEWTSTPATTTRSCLCWPWAARA